MTNQRHSNIMTIMQGFDLSNPTKPGRLAIRYGKLIFVLSIIFFLFSDVHAKAEEHHSTRCKLILDNGAAIVCEYMPDSPVTIIQIRVLSGLSNEGDYAGSGISHFLEHLLFKGTCERSYDEMYGQIRRIGGIANGATGLDSAEYYITVPNENFVKGLDLLTDMIMDPVFTDEEIATERDVVLKEINLRKDTPENERMRKLFATAYLEHIYKYPIIGYIDRFKSLTREDILKYHGETYTPDRIVMGVAGGVHPEAVLEAAENKLKKYRRGKPWVGPIEREPKQLDQRIEQFPADTNLGYLAIGFHTTSLFSKDLYPMDVLSILLGNGKGSRLHDRLVRDKKLLYTVSCFNMTPRYPGLFVITGIGEPDKLEEAREEAFSVIEELKTEAVDEKEIERAKNIVTSVYLHSNERVEEMVSYITTSQLLTGDPSFHEKYVEKIKKVRGEQIKKVISKYLDIDNSTTVSLVPPAFLKKEKAGEELAATSAEEGDESITALGNGLKLIIKKRERLPIVSVFIAFPGGLRAETPEDNGISDLTASLTLKGTKHRKEEGVVPALEGLGGSISAFSGRNSMGIAMNLLSGDLDKGMDVFEDVIKNPTFPEEEIKKQKEKITASIREEEKDIFTEGMDQLRKLLYGDHPYAMKVDGKAETVDRISRKEIVEFYKNHFVPGKAVMTIVGDVDIEHITKEVLDRFGDWKGKVEEVQEEAVKPLTKVIKKDLTMGKEQSLLLIGFQGVDIYDHRKHALSIIGNMLSGGGGMLYKIVREQHGLAYVCGASSMASLDPGYFVLYVSTTEKNIKKARKLAFDAIKSIRGGDFSEEDMESAKNKMLTVHASSLEINSTLAMLMGLDELYGLGFQDYKKYPADLKRITRQEIISCAKEILDPGKYAEVVIHSSVKKKEEGR